MLWRLTAKWGGKTDDTLRLAYTASDAAPPGSPLHSLVAEAHIEHTVFLAMEGRSDEARWYWQEPRVLSDLRLSAERTRAAAGPFTPRARNVLAYAASRADLRDVAHEQFAALGDVLVEGPYQFNAHPGKLFAADRKKAGVR
ncbi:MAG: hypothetical protein M3P95_07190 [Actinomycetota bacterium]|nr:hypothetical protein [Actinomycetota bacterium]